MIEKVKGFSRDAVVPVSFSLLVAMVVGVWTLRGTVEDWEQEQSDLKEMMGEFKLQMDELEDHLAFRWTFLMMREYEREAKALNPDWNSPDVTRIRDEIQKATWRK